MSEFRQSKEKKEIELERERERERYRRRKPLRAFQIGELYPAQEGGVPRWRALACIRGCGAVEEAPTFDPATGVLSVWRLGARCDLEGPVGAT